MASSIYIIDNLAKQLIVKEFIAWHRLRHPNILPCEGICYFRPELKIPSIPSFVSPYQKSGQISKYLSDKPDVDIIYIVSVVSVSIFVINDKNSSNVLPWP